MGVLEKVPWKKSLGAESWVSWKRERAHPLEERILEAADAAS
jgi:hypothetical protein